MTGKIWLYLSAILVSSAHGDIRGPLPIIEYVNPVLYRIEHIAKFDPPRDDLIFRKEIIHLIEDFL